MSKLTKIGVDRDADGVFPVYVDDTGSLWALDPSARGGRLCEYIPGSWFDVLALRDEAVSAGDSLQVAVCDEALRYHNWRAGAICLAVALDARQQSWGPVRMGEA